VVAGLQRRQDRGGHRGHAGRGGARGFGAFELDHAALEHRDVGIGKARIEKAGILALEARLALLGGVVDKALRQEQRSDVSPNCERRVPEWTSRVSGR
jgi:hypothetical protein